MQGLALHKPRQRRRRQHLRQNLRLAALGIIEVERHARAALRLEEAAIAGIVIGPVADHRHHARRLERLCDRVAVDGVGLVDLAGEAPVGGEIEEDRLAGCAQLAAERASLNGVPVSALARRDLRPTCTRGGAAIAAAPMA